MARTDFKSVDEYLDSQPVAVREVLERVRRAIRKALPAAEEVISYQIPAYALSGACVIYFAGWKHHYSIYPATRRVVESLGGELAAYEFNNKGTIRFALSAPVPVRLIGRIARLRAQEVTERKKVKGSAVKKRRA